MSETKEMTSSLLEVVSILNHIGRPKLADQVINEFSNISSNIDQLTEIARCYYETKNFAQSIVYAERALTIAPTPDVMYSLRANLAKLYNQINDPVESIRFSKSNLFVTVNDYDTKLELMFSYFLLNKKEESKNILLDMLNEESLPEEVRKRLLFNLGTHYLYEGKFKEGLYNFLIVGKELGIWKPQTLPFKQWNKDNKNVNVIVLSEGGYGDELINIRFLENIEKLDCKPIWLTSRSDIASIVKRMGFSAVTSLDSLNTEEEYYWTGSMSLPVTLDLSEKQVNKGVYLTPRKDKIEKHLEFKGKVGIKCSGNPYYDHELHRSIPIEVLEEYLDPSREYVSLHIAEEIRSSMYDLELVTDFISDFEDTLGLLWNLDYVVTSCTSIAHAAAALGKRVFIFVPITAYYLWCSTSDTSSLWYNDNVTVLRQVEHKSWIQPLEQFKSIISQEKSNESY